MELASFSAANNQGMKDWQPLQQNWQFDADGVGQKNAGE